MKILAIRGSNLASLDGSFEVRFDVPPLKDVGIFAICGPTGSGKSTLLDALCLALYDRTPRLDGKSGIKIGREGEDPKDLIGDQDTRSILRRGAAEGRAEVDFIGRDRRRYRATWSTRRARARVDGRFQQVEVALCDLDTNESLVAGTRTETLAAIEARVGLPFEQFRRSVLLAQGDFAAFLRASAGERADLLERMTGTAIYARLSIAAFERARTANEHLREIDVRIGEARPLEADARIAHETERAAADTEVVRVRAELASAQAAASWHATRASLATRAATATAAAAGADQAWELVGGCGGLTDPVARAAAEGELEALRALDHEVTLARAHAVARRTALAEATSVSDSTRVAREKAVGEFRTLEERIRDGEAFAEREKSVEAIASDWTRIHGRLERIIEAREFFARTEVKILDILADLKTHAVEAAAVIDAHQNAVVAEARARDALDATRRALAEIDPIAARTALESALAVESAIRAMRDAAATAANEAKSAVAEGGARDTARTESERHVVLSQEAGGQTKLLEARLAELRRARERDLAAQSLASHRTALIVGVPCPLCGALDHAYVLETPAFDAAVIGHDARIVELERDLGTAAKTSAAEQAKADAAKRRAIEADDRAKRAATAAQTATAQWTTARESAASVDVPTTMTDPAAHERAASGASEAVSAARTRVADAERARAEESRAVAVLDIAMKAVSTANTSVSVFAVETKGLETRRDALVNGLASERKAADDALAEIYAPLAPLGSWSAAFDRGPTAYAKALGARVGDWNTRYAELRADRNSLVDTSRRVDDAKSVETKADEALASVRNESSEADKKAEKTLGIRAARFGGRTTAHIERMLAAARDAHGVARQRARDLAEHEAGDAPSLTAPEATARVSASEARRTSIEGRLGELRQLLGQDDLLRRRVEGLRAEFDAAKAAARTWQDLSELIGSSDGKKFRVFAQSLTLIELVASANVHLKGLRPRYRLERVPTTDLDLQVIDRDLGDEVRALASLSGGETFLVSLALALGLSSLAAQDVRLDSLFVDEGFGTLDPETLESALAVLDALQAEGRQVGLISHVSGLAERLGARIEVRPVGIGTSRVRVVAG